MFIFGGSAFVYMHMEGRNKLPMSPSDVVHLVLWDWHLTGLELKYAKVTSGIYLCPPPQSWNYKYTIIAYFLKYGFWAREVHYQLNHCISLGKGNILRDRRDPHGPETQLHM